LYPLLLLLAACGPATTPSRRANTGGAGGETPVEEDAGVEPTGPDSGAQHDSVIVENEPDATPAVDTQLSTPPDTATEADVGRGRTPDAAIIGGCPTPTPLYVSPAPAWITAPNEMRTNLEISSGDIAAAQTKIDQARAANAGAVLAIHLSGSYEVTSAPLKLPSLSSLVITGSLHAKAGATASALIIIDNASHVGVAGGTLDGGGAALNGIVVTASTKVNLDGVAIANVGRDGISVDGAAGAEARSTVIGCAIAHASGSGIVVKSGPQTIVADNTVTDSGSAGIDVEAPDAIVANNTVARSPTGIRVGGTGDAVAHNSVCASDTAIALAASGNASSIFQNDIVGAKASGVALAGTDSLLFANGGTVTTGGSGNYVVSDAATPVAGTNYFHPPTIDNRHKDATIVNGRGRQDVAVNGGTLAAAQASYDGARTAHPNDFIVVTLSGAFTQAGAGLLVDSYTAVVIAGTIDVQATATSAAIGAKTGTSFVSISGGTIDGHGHAPPALEVPSTMSYVDHVTIRNFGVEATRIGSGVIHMTGNGGFAIVRGCTIAMAGGRGVWTKSGRRYLVIDNAVTNVNQDGIDFDYRTAGSIATGNHCESNTRYGVFVEEGANHNKVWNNDLIANAVGVNIIANVNGPTVQNTVAFNRATGKQSAGVRAGAGPMMGVGKNFVFNNVVSGATAGLRDDEIAVDDYFSQNLPSGNTADYQRSSPTTDVFNSLPAP
jgi:hypothetical protein